MESSVWKAQFGELSLESLFGKLDEFGDKLVAELGAVRNELKTNQFADQTIGNKMDIMITKCNTYDKAMDDMTNKLASITKNFCMKLTNERGQGF